MDKPAQITPRTIVAAVDLSDMTPAILEHALEVAAHLPSVDLHLLHVIEDPPPITDPRLRDADTTLRLYASEALDAFPQPDKGQQRRIIFHTRSGRASDSILELVFDTNAHQLVVGAHGSSGRERSRLGGVPTQLIERAPCSVLVVRVPSYEPSSDEACSDCERVRATSDGESWFCSEHRDERVPRLSGRAGNPSLTVGWGLW